MPRGHLKNQARTVGRKRARGGRCHQDRPWWSRTPAYELRKRNRPKNADRPFSVDDVKFWYDAYYFDYDYDNYCVAHIDTEDESILCCFSGPFSDNAYRWGDDEDKDHYIFEEDQDHFSNHDEAADEGQDSALDSKDDFSLVSASACSTFSLLGYPTDDDSQQLASTL